MSNRYLEKVAKDINDGDFSNMRHGRDLYTSNMFNDALAGGGIGALVGVNNHAKDIAETIEEVSGAHPKFQQRLIANKALSLGGKMIKPVSIGAGIGVGVGAGLNAWNNHKMDEIKERHPHEYHANQAIHGQKDYVPPVLAGAALGGVSGLSIGHGLHLPHGGKIGVALGALAGGIETYAHNERHHEASRDYLKKYAGENLYLQKLAGISDVVDPLIKGVKNTFAKRESKHIVNGVKEGWSKASTGTKVGTGAVVGVAGLGVARSVLGGQQKQAEENVYLEKIAKSSFRPVNPAHKGLLHEEMGKAQDEPISEEELRHVIAISTDPHTKRRAQFALNARKWHHKKKA